MYFKPKVVLSLISHFSVIITYVTFPDQAADGSFVWVSSIPQYSAVVEAKFVFGIWREATVTGRKSNIDAR